jgi:hypothetical protein
MKIAPPETLLQATLITPWQFMPWFSSWREFLAARRALFSILVLFISGLLAAAGDFPPMPVLAFSLTATNQNLSHRLGSGLILRVERDELGWEVGVYQHHSTDSLLYPQHNWHGAFPCQLSAWSQRVIPIRGRKSSVCIRLIHARVSGQSGSERFSGGRVEIFFKRSV